MRIKNAQMRIKLFARDKIRAEDVKDGFFEGVFQSHIKSDYERKVLGYT